MENKLDYIKVVRCKNCIRGNNMIEDLTNKRFDRLKVIKRVKNNKYGSPQWLCECKCGNQKIVKSNSLVGGKTRSCGCLSKERVASDEHKTKVKLMGLNNRKHFGCMLCGNENHYAKGLCKNCYCKEKRTGRVNNYILSVIN